MEHGLAYRCLACGVRRDVAAEAADSRALADLVPFLRQHAQCSGRIALDRVIALPEPRTAPKHLLGSGYVDGDVRLHAIAGSSPVVLCSGQVVLSRENAAFPADTPLICAECARLLQRVNA
ncbi:MAG: hypothetical protein LC789_02865 [Actinobacteria bacterium]|nr:hypothetical protein [Actinomycetota bacterium]MCA1720834.1 hypothetical protein [Actinomycetota bacterium]